MQLQKNFREANKVKKFISIGLSILLALSCLTGCGGGDNNDAGGSGDAGATVDFPYLTY